MDKIWNNPLMWQNKKSDSKSEYDFNFDIELNIDQDDLKKMEGDFSIIDAAAKASEYKETTPQMGQLPQSSSLLKDLNTNPNDTNNKIKTDKNTLLARLFDELPLKDLPSMNELLGDRKNMNININVKYNIFNEDDEEANAAISEKMGIDTASLYDDGKKIGLSSLDIIDNIDVLRSSASMKKLTAGLLSENDLTNLYRASMTDNKKMTQDVLDQKNIVLPEDITLEDIMNLSGSVNDPNFKKIYFSNE